MIERNDFGTWRAEYMSKQGYLVKMIFDNRKDAQKWLYDALKSQ